MPACESPHAQPQPGGKRGRRGIQKAKGYLGLAQKTPDCLEKWNRARPQRILSETPAGPGKTPLRRHWKTP